MGTAKFGCQLSQNNSNVDEVIEIALECERLGYDSVWAYDHLSPYWIKSGYALECWTLLSAIAARTKRIKIGSLVTNIHLRNPALLAKMSSTLDNISDGRLILGMGTGDKLSRNELLSYGYSYAPMTERIARLRETIQILKAMWTEEETSMNGQYFKTSRARNYPKPKQTPHPPIWIGGKHQKLLDVVAEMADGWNYWGLMKTELAERERYLQSRCHELKRRPDDLVESWAGTVPIAPEPVRHTNTDGILSALSTQTTVRTRYFIASFPENSGPEGYEAFADAVRKIG